MFQALTLDTSQAGDTEQLSPETGAVQLITRHNPHSPWSCAAKLCCSVS